MIYCAVVILALLLIIVQLNAKVKAFRSNEKKIYQDYFKEKGEKK